MSTSVPLALVSTVLGSWHRARRLYWKTFEPPLLGVRTLIVREGQVMLVRHTYQPGWYLPGGKVDRGETALSAACREAKEECGVVVHKARLVGVYSNREVNRNDHIMLYLAEDFSLGPRSLRHHLEIAEARFFPRAALPTDITPATVRRLQEHESGCFEEEYW